MVVYMLGSDSVHEVVISSWKTFYIQLIDVRVACCFCVLIVHVQTKVFYLLLLNSIM